jgi:deazaflavin-dependent oxidoreductase (nitroreductase family)
MLFGQEHVERYRETGGEEGHDWNGASVLILTATGRRSAQKLSTPLIYGTRGDDYLVVASKGGAPEHPAWYQNLLADPDAEIQVRSDRFPVRARTATGEEREELWAVMIERWPAYDEYQAKTEREIPVVVLERT